MVVDIETEPAPEIATTTDLVEAVETTVAVSVE
jgi:hypothetical protein